MKIAVSSHAYAGAFAAGRSTQLEWLDACANELEADGVVYDLADFPRTDAEYLAQLKKSATDLGLTAAAVACSAALPGDGEFAIASALGAPIAIARAPEATDDPSAWNAFVDGAKTSARAAKRAGVVIAMAAAGHTLCPDAAGLKRLSYDVDGSWLRYALDPLSVADDADLASLLGKTVVACVAIGDAGRFGRSDDARSTRAIASLARFRGFVVVEPGPEPIENGAFHAAVARFRSRRNAYLDCSRGSHGSLGSLG